MGTRLLRILPWLLAVVVTVIAWRAPNQLFTDARGTLLVSQSVVDHGTVSLSGYKAERGEDYRTWGYRYQFFETPEGEVLYAYPLGNSLVAVPAIWLARQLGYDMFEIADARAWHQGLAALTLGAAFLLVYALSRIWLPRSVALAWAVAFTLGTSLASTAGTVLWGQTGLLLWSLAALWLLLDPRFAERRVWAVLGGFCLFLVFIARPHGAFIIAAVLGYLLLCDRRRLPWAVLGSLPPLLAYLAVFYPLYHELPGTHYYSGTSFELSWHFVQILAYGVLFSPSRGLFVFSPVLLVVLVLAVVYARRLPDKRKLLIPAVVIPAYLVLIASWEYWEGGWSFGPRLLADCLPGWALLGPLALAAWRTDAVAVRRAVGGVALLVTGAFSVWVNAVQGLYNPSTLAWNGVQNLNERREILWDWRFAQFLATPERLERQRQALDRRDIVPAQPGEPLPVTHPGLSFGAGWHGLEHSPDGDFRWSSAAPNRLTLRHELLRALPRGQPLRIRFTAGTFGGEKKVVVLLHGQAVAEWAHPDNGVYELTLSPEQWQTMGDLTLELHVPGAQSPSAVSDSPDTRTLGLWLRVIYLGG
ncbi:MAG: hypothetical protein Q7P63_04895 [Verrucomicrobiota bacterium JB022]|nr:hypothetical protein [Verrucomicrobiota bacterium JB022]